MKTPTKQPLKTLIVAAHASELSPLTHGERRLVIKDDIAFLSAGIGPVAAAFGLTHFLEDHTPKRIITIGTAGVINKKSFKIGDVVCAKSVTTVSGMAAAYTPGLQIQKIVIPPLPGLRPPSPHGRGEFFCPLSHGERVRVRGANIYSPQEITRSTTWQRALVSAGHDVEHLESFAFAFVAQKFKIPIQIFLGLTNVIGPNAHKEWVQNATTLLEATCAVVKSLTKPT